MTEPHNSTRPSVTDLSTAQENSVRLALQLAEAKAELRKAQAALAEAHDAGRMCGRREMKGWYDPNPYLRAEAEATEEPVTGDYHSMQHDDANTNAAGTLFTCPGEKCGWGWRTPSISDAWRKWQEHHRTEQESA